MGLSDYVHGPKFRKECERLTDEIGKLQKILKEMGALDLVEIKNEIEKAKQKKDKQMQECEIKAREAASIQREIDEKRNQILVVDETLLLESFALYLPKFAFISSDEYKAKLNDIREKQKIMIKNGTAAEGNQNWSVNNSKVQGKKLVNDMIKLIVRAFNNECDYCVDNVKFNNIEVGQKRVNQSFDSLNRLGKVMEVEIANKYKQLKLDELHLAYEYQVKKQEEKDAQKKMREELKEQQKLEQEIRAAREKIEKERKHFKTALKTLEDRLVVAKESEEEAAINERILEIRAQFNELDNEEKLIDYREKNAKAGYIYVISNIGAFGENVYKIGMTRRLEPMERVDDLGDASVPFSFDVHALVFSDNAPALEAKLHEHFYSNRLNKLNNRKEFYRADIEEIEKVIKDNYDKAVEVQKDAPAEQYRESLLMK
jgi:hypothetical protein